MLGDPGPAHGDPGIDGLARGDLNIPEPALVERAVRTEELDPLSVRAGDLRVVNVEMQISQIGGHELRQLLQDPVVVEAGDAELRARAAREAVAVQGARAALLTASRVGPRSRPGLLLGSAARRDDVRGWWSGRVAL